jgi:catechol 2,3-dioxygenase-like lactoylglutathione lyase family enzyme
VEAALPTPSLLNGVNHIGIVVADLGEATQFLSNVLGLELLRERDVPERHRKTAYFDAGDVEIELIEDYDAEARERVLGGARAVIEHISFDVDDLERTTGSLVDLGVRLQGAIVQVGTRRNAWTEPATSGGVMFQLSAETGAESEAR